MEYLILFALLAILFIPVNLRRNREAAQKHHDELLAQLQAEKHQRVSCPYCSELIMPVIDRAKLYQA